MRLIPSQTSMPICFNSRITRTCFHCRKFSSTISKGGKIPTPTKHRHNSRVIWGKVLHHLDNLEGLVTSSNQIRWITVITAWINQRGLIDLNQWIKTIRWVMPISQQLESRIRSVRHQSRLSSSRYKFRITKEASLRWMTTRVEDCKGLDITKANSSCRTINNTATITNLWHNQSPQHWTSWSRKQMRIKMKRFHPTISKLSS